MINTNKYEREKVKKFLLKKGVFKCSSCDLDFENNDEKFNVCIIGKVVKDLICGGNMLVINTYCIICMRCMKVQEFYVSDIDS